MEIENKETQEIKNNVIFLIGNGYDLYNDLNTSYYDFMLWYISNVILEIFQKNYDNTYEDDCIIVKINRQKAMRIFEYSDNQTYDNIFQLLKKTGFQNYMNTKETIYIGTLESFENCQPAVDFTMEIMPKNDFIYDILVNCKNCDWGGIEASMYSHYRSIFKIIHNRINDIHKNKTVSINDNQIEYFNKSIITIKRRLKDYLSTFSKVKCDDNVFKNGVIPWLYKPNNYNSALFLNFNYTTYLKDQLKIDIDTVDLSEECTYINIHGDINSSLDEIVFGIGDEQEEFLRDIESYYHDKWLEPLKSFFYLKNNRYQDLLGFIAKGNYEIYVVGHSCSITDRTLLKMLFENEYCKKIHVMHYNMMDSYLKTAYNISRNFDNKIKLRKVLQPFDPKLVLNRSK